MKPAPFRWHGPDSVAQALALLAEHGPDVKVLAGGQSLVPMLAMRLAEPAHLVDLNRIAELDTLDVEPGGVRIGALARHARVEHDDVVFAARPLLRQALRLVAHPTIRNRGTSVGSLVHADPTAELTAVLALTGGSVTAASTTGTRVIEAADFFVGPLESALRPDELAVSAWVPAAPERSGSAFVELSRRSGDYAVCGVAAEVVLEPAGTAGVARVRCAYLGVSDVPLVVDLTDAWSDGEPAAAEAARRAVEPETDLHATADYRRHVAGVLTVRAIRQAVRNASDDVTAAGTGRPAAGGADAA